MTMGVASLGMYDHPSQQQANDRLWTAIAGYLRDAGVADVPDALDRKRSVQDLWRDPQLLFGQICGYPLLHDGHDGLQLLGLPDYRAVGCGEGTHCSFIIARSGDTRRSLPLFRASTAVINDSSSNSGMNLFRAEVAPFAVHGRFFGKVVISGSHRGSMIAVADGNADVAAIDAVTYAALLVAEPALVRQLRVLDQTCPSPTLPFVTAADTPPDTVAALKDALHRAIADRKLAQARKAIFLRGVRACDAGDLESINGIANRAAISGYPRLV